MDLVHTLDAVEMIKTAQPGAILRLGLYKNAQNEKEYKEVCKLLSCDPTSKISDGAYKIYSVTDTTNTYATGWINGKVWEFYSKNPAQSTDVLPDINGFVEWPDFYNSLDEYIDAINSNKNMPVNAVYDANTDKIMLTATVPGESGQVKLAVNAHDTNWPIEYGEVVSPGGYLAGDFHEAQNGIHVWIKNTPIVSEEYADIEKVSDITIVVKSNENFQLNLSHYWKWDEYTEEAVEASVDWGDDTHIEMVTPTYLVHDFVAGEYNININGLHWCGSNDVEPIKQPITKIYFNKDQVVDSPNNVFAISDVLEEVKGKIYISPIAGVEDTEIKFA